VSDFRFRALISVVFQPLCPACSLFLFRRINDDDDDDLHTLNCQNNLYVMARFGVAALQLCITDLRRIQCCNQTSHLQALI